MYCFSLPSLSFPAVSGTLPKADPEASLRRRGVQNFCCFRLCFFWENGLGSCACSPRDAPCRRKAGAAGGTGPRMRGGAPGRPLPPPAGEKGVRQAALLRACAVEPPGALCRPLPARTGYCRRRGTAHARWSPRASSAAPCRREPGTAGGAGPRMRSFFFLRVMLLH